MAKKSKIERRGLRYAIQTVLGNFAVYDQIAGRVVAICTRRSDARQIVKGLNRS